MEQSLYDKVTAEVRFVRAELQDRKGTWTAIAEATGISKRTIEKIADETIEQPGLRHLDKLVKYFRQGASA